MSGHKP